MADIVDDFLQRLRAICPDTPSDKLAAVERDVRLQWGGLNPYVGKGVGTERKQQRLAQALAEGRPLAEAFRAAGVGRRQGFYMLNRPQR